PRSAENAIRIPAIGASSPGISSFGRIDAMSLGCGPAITFCSSAQSATFRASGPSWQEWSRLKMAISGTRPYGGLNPTTPQNDAGILIEPPMSEPVASVAVPAASAAADPPLEPPGEYLVFH